MKNILVPIEAGHLARTRSAIAQAVRAHREEGGAIHLLLVQPRVSGHVASYFSDADLRDARDGWAREDLQPAQALLDDAGVPYTSIVKVGPRAATIAAQARALLCERILFGEEEPGLAGRLFGTLAQQVRHLLHSQGDPLVLGS